MKAYNLIKEIMKKIFGILLVSSILFVSCSEDLLEPFTPGSLTEDVAIKKSSDLVNLVNSSMNILTNRTEYVFSSVFTDGLMIFSSFFKKCSAFSLIAIAYRILLSKLLSDILSVIVFKDSITFLLLLKVN